MDVGYQVSGAGEEQMTAGAGFYRYPPATAGGTDKARAFDRSSGRKFKVKQ
jgi:hypothetical protein